LIAVLDDEEELGCVELGGEVCVEIDFEDFLDFKNVSPGAVGVDVEIGAWSDGFGIGDSAPGLGEIEGDYFDAVFLGESEKMGVVGSIEESILVSDGGDDFQPAVNFGDREDKRFAVVADRVTVEVGGEIAGIKIGKVITFFGKVVDGVGGEKIFLKNSLEAVGIDKESCAERKGKEGEA